MKWGRTISYTSGSIAANLVSLAFGTYVQFYYTDVLSGSAKWIGIAAIIQATYATLVYPFLGYLSDRTTSRWGRRVPFIIYGAFPLGVFFMLVWVPPVSSSQVFLFTVYFLITAILYDTLFNVTMVNWSSLFPELFRTSRDRAYASAWKQMFGILGLVAGLGLTPMLASSLGWSTMGMLFGIIGIASLLATFPSMRLKERKRIRARETLRKEMGLPIRAALKYTMVNKPFLTFVGMRFFVQFAFTMLTADLSYYAKYNLQISPSQQSYLLLGTLLVALPLVYVWSFIVTRIGAFKTTITAILLFGAALVPFILAKSFVSTLLCGVGLGIGLSGILMLTDVLISDVIDADELQTGERREGMFYGIHGLIVGLCTPAQAAVTTVVLLATGYVHHAREPLSALFGFQLMITWIPMASLLVGLVLFLFYPLRRQQVMENKSKLEAKSTGSVQDLQ